MRPCRLCCGWHLLSDRPCILLLLWLLRRACGLHRRVTILCVGPFYCCLAGCKQQLSLADLRALQQNSSGTAEHIWRVSGSAGHWNVVYAYDAVDRVCHSCTRGHVSRVSRTCCFLPGSITWRQSAPSRWLNMHAYVQRFHNHVRKKLQCAEPSKNLFVRFEGPRLCSSRLETWLKSRKSAKNFLATCRGQPLQVHAMSHLTRVVQISEDVGGFLRCCRVNLAVYLK